MTTKDKGRTPDQDATQKTTDTRNSTASIDPLVGWFNLAKPARNRQQKRGWQEGGRE